MAPEAETVRARDEELLHGIIMLLMRIDARLERLESDEEDDGEDES